MNKKYCPYCMTPVPEGESCSVCGLTSGTYVPSPHHLPPGTILMGRYLVGRVLGEGGFGITYIGRDMRLELKVAIKEYYPVDRATRNSSASLEVTNFIGPSAKSFERGKKKFLDEAQVMARMDKQQVIVSVRDFFEVNNTAYIVMEYIEGITFHELVERKGGKIPPEELFPIIEPLFRALSIMHENGLIHRDISPDNLMLENGRVRLLDFGCAREASRGTETMTIALKHGYAPIEQYQQKGQGPWTDIYALSATIYYCLTGKIPPQALDRITEDELLLPGKLGISLSAGQEKALLRGMRLQPNRRFSNMEELWSALYKKTEPEPIPEQDVSEETREKQQEQPAVIPSAAEPRTGTVSPEAVRTETDPGTPAAGQGGIETDSGTQSISSVPEKHGFRQKSVLLKAAAVCAVLILGLCIYHFGQKKMSDGDGAAGNQVTQKADLGTEEDSKTYSSAAGLFSQAREFTSGDGEEFRKLIEDDTVPAVSINCSFDTKEMTVTKPVRVEKKAYCRTDRLTVTEEGCLQVEGHLDMTGSGYIRLEGRGTRLLIADGGAFSAEDTFLWMDDKGCFVREDGADTLAHQLVFSEKAFEGDDVESVKDFESLKKAAEQGKTIRIDADITLKDFLFVNTPVRIAEGVTVRTESDGVHYGFVVRDGGVLINDGSLFGYLQVIEGAAAVNNGTFINRCGNREVPASLWVKDESTVVNFGTMEADDISRFWDGSLFLNMGDFQACDFYLVGGNMSNFGRVMFPENADSCFRILNGSRLWNKDEGTVTVSRGAALENNGWIYNMGGDICVKRDGRCFNTVLVNEGSFQAENGADLDAERDGIYYGTGEFDLGDTDIKVYYTADPQHFGQDKQAEVKNMEELVRKLESPDVEALRIAADITADQDLTIRKPLFVDSGCSLTMADGAALSGHGNAIVLGENASLQGSSIALYDNAELYMEDGSSLTAGQGGTLTLDSALLYGNGGKIQINEVELLIKNRAAFSLASLSSFEAENSRITLQDRSVFATPDKSGMKLSGAILTMEGDLGSCFYAASNTTLENCRLDISTGRIFGRGRKLIMENCTAAIGTNAVLDCDCTDLSLLNGTTLENAGNMYVRAWDDYLFRVEGTITNHGNMEIDLSNIRLSNPINNQGNLYLPDSVDGNAYATGNAPAVWGQSKTEEPPY